MVSAGRNAVTSTSMPSRSSIACRYSARVSRWKGRWPGLGALAASRSMLVSRKPSSWAVVSVVRDGPPGTRRRHHSGLQFADHLFSRFSVVRRLGRLEVGQAQATGHRLVVVTADAVLLDHFSVFRRLGRACRFSDGVGRCLAFGQSGPVGLKEAEGGCQDQQRAGPAQAKGLEDRREMSHSVSLSRHRPEKGSVRLPARAQLQRFTAPLSKSSEKSVLGSSIGRSTPWTTPRGE